LGLILATKDTIFSEEKQVMEGFVNDICQQFKQDIDRINQR